MILRSRQKPKRISTTNIIKLMGCMTHEFFILDFFSFICYNETRGDLCVY